MPTISRIPLHDDQTDASLHRAWEIQDGRCMSCEEVMPWHRGVVHKSGGHRHWRCMLCSLLNSAIDEQPGHVEQTWEEGRDLVPVPNRYRLVWVDKEWLPYSDGFRTDNPVHVARLLGCAAADRIWSAVHEDSLVAKQSPFRPDPKSAVPVLLKLNESHRLGGYLCMDEEIKTTQYIHEFNDLKENDFELVKVHVAGAQLSLLKLPPSQLAKCRSLPAEGRRTSIPRCGVADPEVWEAIEKTRQQPLGSHVKTLATDDGMLVYFASIRDCVSLYGQTGKNGLCRDYPDMRGKVGYDFGSLVDPKAAAELPLWERVFGNDLVRFAALDESISSNNQQV